MAQIWKAPHVAEPDTEPHLGQEVLDLTVPAGSGGRFRRALLTLPTDETGTLRIRGPGFVIVGWQRLFLHLRTEEEKL